MVKQQNKTPEVRFPEFEGEWEVKRLSELVNRVTTKNKENNSNVCTISSQYGLISQLEYFKKSVSAKNITGYYLLNKNDFAYNKSYSKGYPMGAIKRLKRYEKGVVSTLYICFKNNDLFDNSFAEHYYESGNQNREIKKVAQEGARNHGLLNIALNDFFSIPITLPTLPEQQKIAHFFSILDKKLTQLQEKKTALELYKKGMMQQIFSQQLRFKDENGQDFPEWEVKKLGDVGEFKNGINKDKKDFGFGIPFINLMDVFGKPTITNKQFGLVNANEKEIKLYEVKKGDVLFIRSSVKKEGVGETTLIKEDLKETVYSGFLIRFRDNKIKLDFNFKQFCFADRRFREDLISLSTTSANTNINQESLNALTIQLPTLSEQTKIANFLSKIDDKINAVNAQIETTKTYKKGLLQKMFV